MQRVRINETLEIEWHNDFRLRCNYKDAWVDFGFDMDGGDKQLGIEWLPVAISTTAMPELRTCAREDLKRYLVSIGYEVLMRNEPSH